LIDLRKPVRASPGRGRHLRAARHQPVRLRLVRLRVRDAAVGCVGLQRAQRVDYAPDVLVPQLAAATGDNPATPVTDLSKAA